MITYTYVIIIKLHVDVDTVCTVRCNYIRFQLLYPLVQRCYASRESRTINDGRQRVYMALISALKYYWKAASLRALRSQKIVAFRPGADNNIVQGPSPVTYSAPLAQRVRNVVANLIPHPFYMW